MNKIEKLKVQLFADGADKASMLEMYSKTHIKGLTTNPTLMKKAGILDYEKFSKDILKTITDKSLSLEVFSDDIVEMRRQALEIATWAENVYVKIPISNTKNESTLDLVNELSDKGVKLNITAIMTMKQVEGVVNALNKDVPAFISIFAGRIADTGRDPMPLVKDAVNLAKEKPMSEILWASTREVYNIFQAEQCGCQIVTVPNSILNKLKNVGYDLDQYSLDTVKMFYNDAQEAGYRL
jgi:transaldolase